jgi:signal transduction histidine kinase
MKKILVFLLLLFSMQGFGQSSKLDSLKTILRKTSKLPATMQRDSAITILLDKIISNTPYEATKPVPLVDSLKAFSKYSLWNQTLAISKYWNGLLFFQRGSMNLAFSEFEKAAFDFKKYHNNYGYSVTISHISEIIALDLFDFPILDKATNQKYESYLLEGLEILKKSNQPALIANQEIDLGLFNFTIKNYSEAYKHYRNSFLIVKDKPDFQKTNPTPYFYFYYGGIWTQGYCSLYLNQTAKGFEMINSVKKKCQTPRSDKMEKYLLSVIGIFLSNYYYEKKDYINALREAEQGYSAYEVSFQFGTPFISNLFNKIFYKTHKALHHPAKALFYQEMVEAYNQQDENKRFKEQYTEWQLKYEDEKQKTTIKTLENDKLQKDNERKDFQRNMLIISLLFGLCLVGYVFWNIKKLKTKNEQLLEKNQEIEQALFKGQTIERKRVAEELHDNLSAKISGIRWRLEAIEPDFKVDKHKQIYQSSVNALAEVYTDVRLIAHNLLPAELETKGLVFALEHLIKELNGLDKIKFSLQISDNLGRFKNKIEYEIFSIILELSNNILKHSQAQNATISLEKINQKLTLTVADNGIGFGENKEKKGMGMDNLKSRVLTLNGNLKVENNGGVSVEIEVPV